MEQMIPAKEAARRLGVTAERMADWRARGEGPPYIKTGKHYHRRVFYLPSDITAWQQEQRQKTNAEALLTGKEVASMFGVHPKTVEAWRRAGKGPAFFKTGSTGQGTVRYRLRDVIAYREGRQTMKHDRDYWRSCSTARLIEEGKNSGDELCIALAERLEDNDYGESA